MWWCTLFLCDVVEICIVGVRRCCGAHSANLLGSHRKNVIRWILLFTFKSVISNFHFSPYFIRSKLIYHQQVESGLYQPRYLHPSECYDYFTDAIDSDRKGHLVMYEVGYGCHSFSSRRCSRKFRNDTVKH